MSTHIDDGSGRGTDKNMSDYLRHGLGRDLAQHPGMLDGMRTEEDRGADRTVVATDEGYEAGAYGRRETRDAVRSMTAIGCPFASGVILGGPIELRGYSIREKTGGPITVHLRENDQNGKVVVALSQTAGNDVTQFFGENGIGLNGLYLEVALGVPEGSVFIGSTE